ncbi:MAG TPA: NAD(P)H-binding protein [Candidatus Brevibacterium intestinigallinarum]|nr:NAD(P)H-binding protein [Candidatus Brevibacterium intestinigallinarum]
MKILIIGATGAAGSRIAAEALQRGHAVTAASRRPSVVAPGATALTLDATAPDRVADAARLHDVVVAATRPAPGREADIDALTTGAADGTRRAERRLIVVGGAAPLRIPGTARIALEDPRWVPPTIREIAAASCRQLEILRDMRGLDWTCLAPAAQFEPGIRTGGYRTGGADLVIDGDGRSALSMEDYAIALLDEIESPTATCEVLSAGW